MRNKRKMMTRRTRRVMEKRSKWKARSEKRRERDEEGREDEE